MKRVVVKTIMFILDFFSLHIKKVTVVFRCSKIINLENLLANENRGKHIIRKKQMNNKNSEVQKTQTQTYIETTAIFLNWYRTFYEKMVSSLYHIAIVF